MGVNLNEGASRIAQLLQPEQPSDSAEEPETAQGEVIQEEIPETEVVDSETEETQAPEEAEGDTETADLYTIKVNGEEREVTLDELRKGYMMESDYRKKTTEVSDKRKAIESKQSELAAKLEDVEAMLKIDFDDLNSAELKELKEYDPAAYYEKKEKLEGRQKRLKDLKSELESENQNKRLQKVEQEKELLFQAIPEWLDDSVLKSEAEMVNKLWTDAGFTPQDLDSYSDHRLVSISRKAALYDKLMSAKPESKKVTPKPKQAKPGTPKTQEQKQAEKTAASRQKLRKTGNMRDAAVAIKQILNR